MSYPVAAVALVRPKYAHNVGNVLRSCSVFRAPNLLWTDERVPHPREWGASARLPREERMKLYRTVSMDTVPSQAVLLDEPVRHGLTPVAVEVRDDAEDLVWFEHPKRAVYVFGPEDGSLDRGVLSACHRFVRIPTMSCLNLATAVAVVLYDRQAKAARA